MARKQFKVHYTVSGEAFVTAQSPAEAEELFLRDFRALVKGYDLDHPVVDYTEKEPVDELDREERKFRKAGSL